MNIFFQETNRDRQQQPLINACLDLPRGHTKIAQPAAVPVRERAAVEAPEGVPRVEGAPPLLRKPPGRRGAQWRAPLI